MHQEIERKYLLSGDDFLKHYTQKFFIRQGYLLREAERTVRIRQRGDEVFLTIKGKAEEGKLGHFEYEQAVPLSAAAGLFALCLPGLIEKERFLVPWHDVVIEVDVFQGENAGLRLAEIELPSEDYSLPLPHWLGEEVTSDVRYYNAYLSAHPFLQWGK